MADVSDWTPIHAAAHKGECATLKGLLTTDNDPCALTAQGDSAVGLAALGGHPECLDLLLRPASAMIDRSNCGGWTPLHLSLLSSSPAANRLASLRLLLASGADAERAAQGGWYPILVAARQGNADAIAALLLHAAAADRTGGQLARMLAARTSEGDNALLLAAHAASVASTRLLLAAGAACDARNAAGLSAVQLVVSAACSAEADHSDEATTACKPHRLHTLPCFALPYPCAALLRTHLSVSFESSVSPLPRPSSVRNDVGTTRPSFERGGLRAHVPW